MTPCKDCENRHCGCHATCQRYMDFYRKNREKNDRNINQSVLNNYTVDAIRNAKERPKRTMCKYRSKGD